MVSGTFQTRLHLASWAGNHLSHHTTSLPFAIIYKPPVLSYYLQIILLLPRWSYSQPLYTSILPFLENLDSNMLRSSLFLSLLSATGTIAQSYSLTDTFSGSTFFDQFDFFTAGDPTNGWTQYVDQATAISRGLIGDPSIPAWGVDHTSVLDPANSTGRASIRLTSKKTWTHGLFIADIVHMPDSTCGLWPAFWTLGQTGTWPYSGEIDIIEGVNSGNTNLISGHTTDNCTIAGSGETGTLLTNDCAVSRDKKKAQHSTYFLERSRHHIQAAVLLTPTLLHMARASTMLEVAFMPWSGPHLQFRSGISGVTRPLPASPMAIPTPQHSVHPPPSWQEAVLSILISSTTRLSLTLPFVARGPAILSRTKAAQ